MVQQRTIRKNALRLAALASVSMAALPAFAETAQTTTQKSLLGPLTGSSDSGSLKPMYGSLRPFYGSLRPFYGSLRPFYGSLRPFWGNLRPFWGDTNAFYGDLKSFWAVDNPVQGAGAPNYLKVGDFWTTTGNSWGQTFDSWNAITPGSNAASYKPIATQLKDIIDGSRDFWGASVKAQTGKSFDVAFANPLLAAYGIDLNNPKSLDKLDPSDRAMFFLDFYDGLMDYTGTDHVDHWMKTINWTPSLTKTQGGGGDTTIGILDQTVVGDKTLRDSVVKYGGVSEFTDGHGAAVGSLIVGAHDGKGVMGIAPMAKVVAYNPFDNSGTANWDDVTRGVQNLKANGADVVNMSLGVPGSTFDPGWNKVFTDLSVMLTLKNTVFVVAAGNEGVTQTKNVEWLPLNPAILVVGSVDVEGNISNFSNRPGNACLTLLGLCLPGNRLMDRFVVAPGELILVSDGQGGTTRQIGTSFAAPLVSGAVALLQDRWPWLVNFPRETADIILKSAKDLGAPGVDPVYGRGLLDVTAAQSPLDFNSLIWFTVENGKQKLQTQKSVLQTYQAAQSQPATWDAKNAYFYAFEPLGLLTQRDFAIPLSNKLIGQSVTTNQGANEQFQSYLLARMGGWAAGKGYLASANGGHSFFSNSVAVANPWGADMSVSFAPRQARYGFRDEGPAFQTALSFSNERSSVTVGYGDGAPALASQPGFNQAADYDGESGGANPLLGFASGGVYAGASYNISDKLAITAGFMGRDQERDERQLVQLRDPANGAASYAAAAQQVSLNWKPTARLTVAGSYTHLDEATGLLGVQSFDPQDLRHGSQTDGVSLGMAWSPSSSITLAASGTMGHTRPSGDSQSLQVDKGGLTTSAFELGVTKTGVFAKRDTVRFTLSQPLYVEKGRLAQDVVQVVDRTTGEIGIVRQSFDVSDQRRVAAEMLYAAPVFGDRSDVTLFGRVETETADGRTQSYMTGARYRVSF